MSAQREGVVHWHDRGNAKLHGGQGQCQVQIGHLSRAEEKPWREVFDEVTEIVAVARRDPPIHETVPDKHIEQGIDRGFSRPSGNRFELPLFVQSFDRLFGVGVTQSSRPAVEALGAEHQAQEGPVIR